MVKRRQYESKVVSVSRTEHGLIEYNFATDFAFDFVSLLVGA